MVYKVSDFILFCTDVGDEISNSLNPEMSSKLHRHWQILCWLSKLSQKHKK